VTAALVEGVNVKRLSLVFAPAAAVAALLVGNAVAAGSITITFSPGAKIASQLQANVPVSVTCAPLAPETDGSVVVTLTQQSGSKTATGSGSAPITCDGQSHIYVVPVTASDGRWHNGSATAAATGSATGWRSTEACGTDSDGLIVCTINTAPATDTGSSGPGTVTLSTD
jgi:hypothetical protein